MSNTSEQYLRVLGEQAHLLDLVHDAIILRDGLGGIIFWNQGAEKLFGWTSGEALGKQVDTLLRTQFPQPWEAIEAEVLRGGRWEGELIRTRCDGTPLVVTSRRAVWRDPDTSPVIVEISTDITERKQVERSQRLLADAGPVLGASLDATSRLANIAQVVVPLLADWCVVHMTEEGQPIQPVAVAHADPRKLAQANDLLRRHPPDPDVPPGAAHVLRTGRPEFYAEVSEELLAAIARDAEQIELVRSLGIKSAMIVPLVTRGHTLGTMTLVVSAESGRHYTEADLALAEELARRAALAVDNARLYAEAQQLNAELEERVAQRTADLQAAVAQLETSRAQLLLLAQHEQTRREEDRARMAREVHDELGQALTGLKMDLAWLQKHTGPKQQDLLQKFRDMSDLVDTTIQGVRRIATELRPGMLDDLGLVPAMEWQLQEFQKRSGIRCTFTSSLEEVALDAEGTTVALDLPEVDVVGQAQDAPETLKAIAQTRPDVVILDIRMPGGNGIEVLREVKKMTPAPQVIMLTNFAYAQYRKKCKEAGADFFFDKSTEFEKLPQALEQVRQGLRPDPAQTPDSTAQASDTPIPAEGGPRSESRQNAGSRRCTEPPRELRAAYSQETVRVTSGLAWGRVSPGVGGRSRCACRHELVLIAASHH